MKIERKILQKPFEKILSGNKTFEIRLANWECKPGDILALKEWNPETEKYTGREIEKTVTYIAKTKDLTYWTQEEIGKYGFQIIAFK